MKNESGSRVKPIALYLIATVVTFLLVAGAALSWLWFSLNAPYRNYPDESILIEVSQGMSVEAIGEELEKKGVVQSADLFWLYTRLSGKTRSLKAGEYQFEDPLSTIEVVRKLDMGDIHYHRVTVPEGLDIEETSALFVAAGFASPEEFETATRLVTLIAHVDGEAENLEGYLFPDTYFLPRGTSASEIVEGMVRRFFDNWTEEFDRRADELDMSVRKIVTLASLIEKETALVQERRLVSAVFHNRLKKGIKLACDPTVIYAVKRIKEFDGVINRSDLDLDSPYNTYLYPGLPPGPIASPGAESISAALNPADSNYLYFVSKNDGSHVFSSTYAEHSRAVRQYQR